MTHEPELREVAAGVYAWFQPDGTWWINNAGAIHSGGEIVLVDTCATRQRTRRFLDTVASATGGAPIRLAVNTHLHGDHVYGNALLPDETVIVAQEATRQGILADYILAKTPPFWAPPPNWEIDTVRAPTVTFDRSLQLVAGSIEVELRHPGHAAHTRGDAVAWLPEQRVLFAGDLVFHQVTPLVFMGSVEGALRALDWLREFPASVVVPGHGPLFDEAAFPSVLDQQARYYRFVLDLVDESRSPLDVARAADLGEFAGLPDQERLVLNLHRAYADARGEELDLRAALLDALAYNGGPMRCAV
jgi:cyclase